MGDVVGIFVRGTLGFLVGALAVEGCFVGPFVVGVFVGAFVQSYWIRVGVLAGVTQCGEVALCRLTVPGNRKDEPLRLNKGKAKKTPSLVIVMVFYQYEKAKEFSW